MADGLSRFTTPATGTLGNPIFWCARCGRSNPILGRRLQMVRGLRTWVCSTCAKPKP